MYADDGFLGLRHGESLWLSQPHPGRGVTPLCVVGPTPENPSSCPAIRSMCPPHDGTGSSLNVRSEITYFSASVRRFGISFA